MEFASASALSHKMLKELNASADSERVFRYAYTVL